MNKTRSIYLSIAYILILAVICTGLLLLGCAKQPALHPDAYGDEDDDLDDGDGDGFVATVYDFEKDDMGWTADAMPGNSGPVVQDTSKAPHGQALCLGAASPSAPNAYHAGTGGCSFR